MNCPKCDSSRTNRHPKEEGGEPDEIFAAFEECLDCEYRWSDDFAAHTFIPTVTDDSTRPGLYWSPRTGHVVIAGNIKTDNERGAGMNMNWIAGLVIIALLAGQWYANGFWAVVATLIVSGLCSFWLTLMLKDGESRWDD